MANNIIKEDLNSLITYLSQDEPMITQSSKVKQFEKEWSKWIGSKYSVFVNSGSSANVLTLQALSNKKEVIVSPLNWVSDITAILQAGMKPVFVDINLETLGMDNKKIIEAVTNNTPIVLMTSILGFNPLTDELLDFIKEKNLILVEDLCEAHGAKHNNIKCGNFGLASNFSFYYAHHMSTGEGGIISTNDEQFYETCRMLRSHGMVRESTSQKIKDYYSNKYPDTNPEFLFAYPAYNMRSTELNAVLGLSQLPRLNNNIRIRNRNLKTFLSNLDSNKYFTSFKLDGCSNYALTLLLKEPNQELMDKVKELLTSKKVEFRCGMSGGGNQLRQPYLRERGYEFDLTKFPNVEHIHNYGLYIGNYSDLDSNKIKYLCKDLNNL